MTRTDRWLIVFAGTVITGVPLLVAGGAPRLLIAALGVLSAIAVATGFGNPDLEDRPKQQSARSHLTRASRRGT
jgi:hypothetical protein